MRNVIGLLLLFGLAACDPGPPVACSQSLPEQELYVGESNQVTPCFDAKALPLRFEIEVSDPAVITGEVFGSQVAITAEAVGNAVITIRAVDNNNLSATQTALVTVPNQPPVLKDQFQYVSAIWSRHEVDLSRYIDDPDRQQLTYRVSVFSATTDVELEIDGNMLHIYGRERGEVEVDIIAIDPEGASLSHAGHLTLTDPGFYITQAAHSKSRDVPLLMNRDGLLRAFLTTDSFNVAMPTATVAFYDGATEIHRAYLDSEGPIPDRIDESTFNGSYAAEIDGAYIRPGVRLVIEFDPTGVAGIERRMEKPLDVIEVPKIALTLVPVVIGNDRSTVQNVARVIAAPETHDVLYHTLNALPIDDYVIRAHAPIEITTDQGGQFAEIMPKLLNLWVTEGQNGYYVGILPHPISGGVAGAAYVSGFVSYSIMSSTVLAHELGHNFSLYHAPCGNAQFTDPNYPYDDGIIGIWGYDVTAQLLKRPTLADLMGYCSFQWISDYSWRLAALYLHSTNAEQQSRGRPGEMLTVWGWVDENGPILNPSMYVDGRPTPLSGDSHSIEMRTDQGEVISYRFGLQEIMDGPGGSAFSHLIPVTWSGELVEIRLEGPEGIAWLDASTDQPYSMVIRDGMVRHLGAGEYRAESGERVIFSRGIPVRR